MKVHLLAIGIKAANVFKDLLKKNLILQKEAGVQNRKSVEFCRGRSLQKDCKLPTCALGLRNYCVYGKYLLSGYMVLNAAVGEVDLKQTYEMFMVLCNSWYVDREVMKGCFS